MAGEMKAKLVLDGKEFDLTLKKSKKSAQEFGKAGKKAGNDFIGAFKSITAAAAALKGAEGAFKAFVDSSQTIGDQFKANIDGMKSVIENFVYSLANADFSPFANGLASMFDKAKEASVAADQFGNTQMATNFLMATQGAAYREAMSKARNKNLSNEERRYWVEQARVEAAAIAEAQKTLERDALEKLKTEIAAQTGLSKYFVGEKAILDAISLDARYNNREERAAIDEAYRNLKAENDAREEAVRKQYTITTGYTSPTTGVSSYTTSYLDGYEEEMAKAQEKNMQRLRANADLIVKYNLLFRKTDNALKEVYATAQSAVAAKNQLSEISTSINEVDSTLTNEMKKSAELVAQEKAAREEYERLAELVRNNPINTSIVKFSPAQSAKEMKAEMLPATNFLTGKSRIEYIDSDALTQEAFDFNITRQADEQAAALENVNTVVGELSNSFASLGGNIQGTTGEMFTFIGSILDAAQAIIPFIGYIQAEMVMHEANASAAAKEAAAKTLSAYAGVPFAGLALGVAGVAGIVAAIQSIPEFAEGGIVTQATLGVFGEAGPEAVMPLDKLEEFISPRELRVTGNIRASGKELVVVLDNYNRVRNG